jgi:hypothetical protein
MITGSHEPDTRCSHGGVHRLEMNSGKLIIGGGSAPESESAVIAGYSTQRCLARLFQTPALTIGTAMQVLGVTHRWASQTIDKLIEARILRGFPARAVPGYSWHQRCSGRSKDSNRHAEQRLRRVHSIQGSGPSAPAKSRRQPLRSHGGGTRWSERGDATGLTTPHCRELETAGSRSGHEATAQTPAPGLAARRT